jgi:hypothetical protein
MTAMKQTIMTTTAVAMRSFSIKFGRGYRPPATHKRIQTASEKEYKAKGAAKGAALSNPNVSKSLRGGETLGETPGIDFECKCGQSLDNICESTFWLNSRRPYCIQKPYKEGDK